MTQGSVCDTGRVPRPWRARLSVDGRRISLGYHATEEAAWRVVRSTIDEVPTEGETLATYGARWLDRRELAGVAGIRQERSCWETHVAGQEWARWPLRRVKREAIVAWLRALTATEAQATSTTRQRVTTRRGLGRTISRQTIAHALALVRRCLEDAADEGLASPGIATGVRVPRQRRSADEEDAQRWTFLTIEELAAIETLPTASRSWATTGCGAIGHAQRSAILVAAYAGLRAGELWGLRWCDVVLEGRPEIHVCRSYRGGPKTRTSRRRVPLLPQAAAALREWRRHAPGVGTALVWPADGGGCHASGYDAGWSHVLRLAGITRHVRFHDLRHTCASHLVMGSWGPTWRLEDACAYLGHSSIGVTQRYAHLAPERLHALVDASSIGPNLVPTAQTEQASRPRKS